MLLGTTISVSVVLRKETGLRVIIFLMLFAPLSVFGAPTFDTASKQKLERGEVILKLLKPSGGEGIAFIAYGLVDAKANKVWPVVRDCQHFKEFMPRTEKSELKEKKGADAICFFELDMPFPFSNLWSTVRSTESKTADGSYLRSWKLLTGTYTRNRGSWRVTMWPADPNRTLLTYNVDVNPKVSLPDFVLRKAQTGALPGVFEAIRERVKSLP